MNVNPHSCIFTWYIENKCKQQELTPSSLSLFRSLAETCKPPACWVWWASAVLFFTQRHRYWWWWGGPAGPLVSYPYSEKWSCTENRNVDNMQKKKDKKSSKIYKTPHDTCCVIWIVNLALWVVPYSNAGYWSCLRSNQNYPNAYSMYNTKAR